MKKVVSIGTVLLLLGLSNHAMASDQCAKAGLGEDFCISTNDAYQMILDDQDNAEPQVFILDVRTPEEWKYIGYPGVNGIGEGTELTGRVIKIDYLDDGGLSFLSDVNEEFEEIPHTTIITMCRSGKRSYNAAKDLLAAGYTVYSMNVGFEGDNVASKYSVVIVW